jgi:hypothetical protein
VILIFGHFESSEPADSPVEQYTVLYRLVPGCRTGGAPVYKAVVFGDVTAGYKKKRKVPGTKNIMAWIRAYVYLSSCVTIAGSVADGISG